MGLAWRPCRGLASPEVAIARVGHSQYTVELAVINCAGPYRGLLSPQVDAHGGNHFGIASFSAFCDWVGGNAAQVNPAAVNAKLEEVGLLQDDERVCNQLT